MAQKNNAPQSTILQIKRKLMTHVKENTSITEVGESINFSHSRKPFAWIQIGPALTREDINGTKDELHEFGIRVVANDEDECWKAVEEIRVLWYGTGALSLFDELHDLGVLNVSHVSTNPGFQFSTGDQHTCDLIFRIEIRYTY